MLGEDIVRPCSDTGAHVTHQGGCLKPYRKHPHNLHVNDAVGEGLGCRVVPWPRDNWSPVLKHGWPWSKGDKATPTRHWKVGIPHPVTDKLSSQWHKLLPGCLDNVPLWEMLPFIGEPVKS